MSRLTWWGRFTVPLRSSARWEIGPFTMVVHRRPWEWHVVSCRSGDPFADALRVEIPTDRTETPPGAEEHRYAFGETADPLTLRPALADRPVVANPEEPFSVLPGEEAVAYLTTPLWCALSVGEPARPMVELPTWRPRDTWFGASTREGELCYASRTKLRLNPTELDHLPHRAVVPVRLVNRGADPLKVERLRLPVPYLPLYEGAHGWLWTPEVTLLREREELARFEIAQRPPARAGEVHLLTPARLQAAHVRVFHAFNSFFRSW